MDKDKPIIALDFKTKEEALEFLHVFADGTLNLKVGMELFYSAGPDFIKRIVEKGHDVFLDLKLYDIPNTVYHAMVQIAKMGVSMVNVHASGGIAMMEAAKRGLEAGKPQGEKTPIIIGVTQLTSRDPQKNVKEQQLAVTQDESILNLAMLTKESGLDGVVCSPLEVKQIKNEIGKQFLTVTPGIRTIKQSITNDDQVRVTTPRLAAELGSDYIVVGRPITKSSNPKEAYREIKTEWVSARNEGR